MSTPTPANKPKILQPKDEYTTWAAGYYKWMNAEQIQRLVYPKAQNYRTATKRLTELACTYDYDADTFLDDGYISYVLMFDKASPRMGRPKRVFFLSASNLRNIAEAYKRRAKLSAFKERFADVVPIESKNGFSWTLHWLQHELAITEYSLSLHEGIDDKTRLLFWERTSPHSRGIARTYRVTKLDPETNETASMDVHFNPDGVECTIGEPEDEKTRLYLACEEIDRDTESEAEFLPKIYAYDEFIKQRHIEDLLAYFTKRYHLTPTYSFLGSPRQYRVNFRIRIVTTNIERRNDLIRLIATHSHYPQSYHVTTFEPLREWPKFYAGAHWYPASGYQLIATRKDAETKYMRPRALTQWLGEQIETHIPPVPYFYSARRAREEATP